MTHVLRLQVDAVIDGVSAVLVTDPLLTALTVVTVVQLLVDERRRRSRRRRRRRGRPQRVTAAQPAAGRPRLGRHRDRLRRVEVLPRVQLAAVGAEPIQTGFVTLLAAVCAVVPVIPGAQVDAGRPGVLVDALAVHVDGGRVVGLARLVQVDTDYAISLLLLLDPVIERDLRRRERAGDRGRADGRRGRLGPGSRRCGPEREGMGVVSGVLVTNTV